MTSLTLHLHSCFYLERSTLLVFFFFLLLFIYRKRSQACISLTCTSVVTAAAAVVLLLRCHHLLNHASITFTITRCLPRTPHTFHPLSPPAAALLNLLTRLTAATCWSNPHTDGKAARCLLKKPSVTKKKTTCFLQRLQRAE